MRVATMAAAVALGAVGPAEALVVDATGITVVNPAGSNNPASGALVDDAYLDSLIFPDATFAGGDSFSAATKFEVTSGRSNINSEWGDLDDGADGDDNPFVKAGHGGESQETTDPAIQDATLLATFNSLSITEMSDGESGGFQFKMLFSDGLTDDQPGVIDNVPELIFFERGLNDTFSVELIIGGTFETPVYSAAETVSSGDFWDTGLDVNTIEIGGAQSLGVGGLDFDDFGLALNAVVYGMRLTVVSGGPDLNGFFLSTEDPSRFQAALGEPPRDGGGAAEVPAPPALAALGLGVAALWAFRRRRET